MVKIPTQAPIKCRTEYHADTESAGQKISTLRELRQLAGKAQIDIASALHIKQPSVSKIEKQADMYVSTLRSYVEAIGGELELTVKLPMRPTLCLHHIGNIASVDPAMASIPQKNNSKPSKRYG